MAKKSSAQRGGKRSESANPTRLSAPTRAEHAPPDKPHQPSATVSAPAMAVTAVVADVSIHAPTLADPVHDIATLEAQPQPGELASSDAATRAIRPPTTVTAPDAHLLALEAWAQLYPPVSADQLPVAKSGPITKAPAVSKPAAAPVQPAAKVPQMHQSSTDAPPSEPAANESNSDDDRPQQLPLLFECGWEVCWQLGGIYTVLRSKAATMLRTWEDRYCLIGPYNPQTAPVEFEPDTAPEPLATVLDNIRNSGLPVHYGSWLIPGRPKTILLDYRAMYRDLDHNKYLMWVDHGISVPPNDGEVNEVVAFGFAVTEFFRQFTLIVKDRAILAHFHEWMAGVAVPRMAHLKMPVSTVFTTHATLLGRYLAGDNAEFYNDLPMINADEEARRYQIFPKHLIEKAAAHASTVFTTVSEVTAFEAEKLLGRRPEVILPNGLNIHRFAALHEFQNLHRQYKEKINNFVMGHFFPCYTFDLDKTIYLFTSGRYEYRNKGMDLFIEAMARLNHRLKYVPDRPTVVVFIVTKAPVRHVNIGALQNQSMFDELKRTCTDMQEEMGQRLLHAAARGHIPKGDDLLAADATVRLKRAMHAWRSGQPPAIVTHDLWDDANDPVLRHLRHRGLFNSGDDPVKMVFHPQFITQTGPLINLDYEQFVRGCHMGIFPSYYEPWGYTPMESVALGLPAVTTDLSGFGAYVRRHIPDSHEKGICVLNRRYRNFDEACNELVDYLFDFVRLSRRQRIELRNKVERLSEVFDWSALIRHYREAHDLALERSGAKRVGKVEVRMV